MSLTTITTTTAADPETVDDTAALETVAGQLSIRRLDTRIERVLKITGIGSAADLAISPDGSATWRYHACHGTAPDPARTTAITATLLHATTTPDQSDCARPAWGSWLIPHLDFLAKTGALAILGHALTATLGHHSLEIFTIPDMLTITSPAQPGRGTVRITTDGTITWHTSIRDRPPGTDGLDLTDIADTIAQVIKTPPILPV